MTKVYVVYEDKPSDMFIESMAEGGIGSNELTCECCGRLHLCPDSEYHEELPETFAEYCKEKYKENPAGVIIHNNCDGIVGRYMNQTLFVLDCPCNGLQKYENFIWEHKNTILEYLNVRMAEEKRWEIEKLALDKLTGVS